MKNNDKQQKILKWLFNKIENMDKTIGELRGEFNTQADIDKHRTTYKEYEREFFGGNQ